MPRFLRAAAFLFATVCFAQTVTPPPSPQTITLPAMPSDLVLAGASYDATASPKVKPWVSYAHQVSAKIPGLYSFTTYDVTSFKAGALQTSIRSGAALYLRSVGPFVLMALGDAGLAQSGSVTSGAYSGGGMLAVQLGKGWSIVTPVRILKTAAGGTIPIYEIGVGWGK